MSLSKIVARVAVVACVGTLGYAMYVGFQLSAEMDAIKRKLDMLDTEFTNSVVYLKLVEVYRNDTSKTLVDQHNALVSARRGIVETRMVGSVSEDLTKWFTSVLDKRYKLQVVA